MGQPAAIASCVCKPGNERGHPFRQFCGKNAVKLDKIKKTANLNVRVQNNRRFELRFVQYWWKSEKIAVLNCMNRSFVDLDVR